jgi:long-chain acyl-CoA synthetase
VTIAYAESTDTVLADLAAVRPTILISVPRLYEKIHARVRELMAASPPLRRRIFRWAQEVGWQAAQYRMTGRRTPPGLRLHAGIADRLVFGKLRARTGGRIRFFVSGGAPLSPTVGRFFFSAGFTIYEGYGLTETGPVLCVNRPGWIKLGTVGRAIPGVEIRVDSEGEILARGPNIMRGYHRNPEATAEMIDADGWLHTGDIGVIDGDGYVTITDRKKDLIVTSGGKNVAPQPIENRLRTSRYISEAIVIGDRRRFPVALIVPEFESMRAFARGAGIGEMSDAELCRHEKVNDLMLEQVVSLCSDLAQYERPKRIALINHDLSIQSGELTPSLKVKRKVVTDRFREIIEALYEE